MTHIAVFGLSTLRCLVAHCVRKIRAQGKPHSHFICECLGTRLGTGCVTGWCLFNWKGSKVRICLTVNSSQKESHNLIRL